ncbi:MAG: hypothetical protein IPL46_04550 [Saprospiraceae bacterium]|nr:hypothetical protein [Saprospiraceae bacterium]
MNDLTKLISSEMNPFEKKGKIFILDIDDRVHRSLKFLQDDYSNYEILKTANEFVDWCQTDATRSDFQTLSKVGMYPNTESEIELDYAIKHALIGSYKSAYGNLRRALELIVVFIYFMHEKIAKEKAISWLSAKNDTPSFSRTLKKIKLYERFSEIENKFEWSNQVQQLFWELSDFGHNKGQKNGYRDLNKLNFHASHTFVPNLNFETLESFANFYIKTVKEIVTLLALYNPKILLGLPIDEKFGLNPPFSGFFYEGQAEIVFKLIPENYQEHFKMLRDNDQENKDIIEWFESMPDLTEEQIREQVKEQDKFFEQMKSDT